MKSQTSLVAQQTHLSEWAEQVRECNNPLQVSVGLRKKRRIPAIRYLLEEIPKHMNDTEHSFIKNLLPWSESLPAEIRKLLNLINCIMCISCLKFLFFAILRIRIFCILDFSGGNDGKNSSNWNTRF